MLCAQTSFKETLAPLILTPSGAGDADGQRICCAGGWAVEQARVAIHEFEDRGYQSDVASGFDFDDQEGAVWRRRGERPGRGI
jgi:hypothetical protein